MKKFLIRLFKILPEGFLKKKIRCYGFNFYRRKSRLHASFKKGYFKFDFKNGITIKSYYDICSDLVDSLRGYLKNYKLQKGDIVIDCGAYLGAFALYAAKIIGSNGLVFAFEPSPENYKKLWKNIKLNRLTNIIPINKGLWSKNTILALNDSHSGGSTFFFNTDKQASVVEVPVVTLDNELKKRRIKKVDFIKMDIEGSEIEAIKGSEKTLKNKNIKLAIASYHIVNGQKTCFRLEKLLSKFGYKVKTSFPTHLTTYATK